LPVKALNLSKNDKNKMIKYIKHQVEVDLPIKGKTGKAEG
jgi:hypothetical protein